MFKRFAGLIRIFVWFFDYLLALCLALVVVTVGFFNFPTLMTRLQDLNGQLLRTVSGSVGQWADQGGSQIGAQLEFLLRTLSFENTMTFFEIFLTILIFIKVVRWMYETRI